MIVWNADGAIVGRIAARAAKEALQGHDVVIVNAKTAVISGNAREIVSKYSKRRNIQNKADPDKSPKWPKREDFMLKKIIRGMLPKKKGRGKDALRKIKVYMEYPKEFEGQAKAFDENASKLRKSNSITLTELRDAL